MATYNGERFIAEQIESILHQTCTDWTLYIHDDGSDDRTHEIAMTYSNTYKNIITLDYPSTKGAKDNFFSLLDKVDSQYYMFCDQDDVWEQDKIELSLQKIQEIEKNNPDTPIIVFSDLKIVDENLNVIADSFWKKMRIKPKKLNSFHKMGACNLVTGCTMMFNKKVNGCIINPKYAIMHDSWISLCVAKNNGIIYPICKPLVNYRQHKYNVIGAQKKKETLFSSLRDNLETYKMLRHLGYGSFLKYWAYKFLYKIN